MSSTFDIANFETPPVEGCFGQLQTINDVIPIVGAGIIRWTVHDHVGNEAIIRVPGYYIPTSTQRLLSPQNYALFHGWDEPTVDCYGGNNSQFWFKLANTEEGEQTQLNTSISVLDGLPYIQILPSFPKEMPGQCVSCSHTTSCQSCAHAYNLSVLLAQNDNLMFAQKVLLLDHQHLGHINVEHLRMLY